MCPVSFTLQPVIDFGRTEKEKHLNSPNSIVLLNTHRGTNAKARLHVVTAYKRGDRVPCASHSSTERLSRAPFEPFAEFISVSTVSVTGSTLPTFSIASQLLTDCSVNDSIRIGLAI